MVALDHLAQQLAACDVGDLHMQLDVPLVHDEAKRRVRRGTIQNARRPLLSGSHR